MKRSDLFKNIYYGEEGYFSLPFEDCASIAKILINKGYAVLFTGGELSGDYRMSWIHAGDIDNVDYAKRSNVCFGLAETVEMLEFGEHEKDEEDNDDSKKGHWIIVYNDNKPFSARCSNCGYAMPISTYLMMKTLRECPNCKIKMEEVEE